MNTESVAHPAQPVPPETNGVVDQCLPALQPDGQPTGSGRAVIDPHPTATPARPGTDPVPPGLKPYLADVATARSRYLDCVMPLTEQQAHYKPSPDVWNAIEITEHLFWAEQGGIWGMWRALQAYRNGTPTWPGDHTNRGRSIEQIVADTWQPREQVPAVAAPRLGGTLAFWCFSLLSLQDTLVAFSRDMADQDPEAIIHPHPISGPLDSRQRFEFIRFHLDRHRNQVNALFA